jgi:hypothetical protein
MLSREFRALDDAYTKNTIQVIHKMGIIGGSETNANTAFTAIWGSTPLIYRLLCFAVKHRGILCAGNKRYRASRAAC